MDSKANKISFEDKIDTWISLMTNGIKFNKGIKYWEHFKRLQQIRDNLSIHAKSSGYSISYGDLASIINLFKTGIAGVLIQLHELFGERIPGAIIRGYYAPDVELVKISE